MACRRERLMSIGEAAKALGITRRMILNYEDNGLLRPDVKEGTAGNRYYLPDTITRMRTIRILQDLGLSLGDIHSYFSDASDLAPIVRRLESLRDELNTSIEKLRARMDAGGSGVARITLPAQTVYRRVLRAETVEQKKEHLRDIVPAAIRTYGTDPGRRMFFTEYSLADPAQVSFCVSVPEQSCGEQICRLEQAQALCVMHHGAYTEIPAVRERIAVWAAQHGIALTGTCRNIYLEGPPHHKSPTKFITQIALLIDGQADAPGSAETT
jgi:DNA-binding transcriptional MerR regulator